MKFITSTLLLIFLFSVINIDVAYSDEPEVSDYSDLVLEDDKLNLLTQPLASVEFFYESNHLFYDISGVEGSLTYPLTKNLSLIGQMGLITSIGNKRLLEYYLSQNPQFNVENFYPKPNSFIELGVEYQLLSSRVNFFNRAAIPLSFGVQVSGITEFYAHSLHRYFGSFAGVLRLQSSQFWGLSFRFQSSSGVDPAENRTTYILGPYWDL